MPSSFNGQTIVFLHGGPGGHCADFEAGLVEFPELSSQGFGWVTYDQRGCGRSKSTPTETLSHRQNIDDLNDLLTALPTLLGIPNKLALYGHSYGARLVYDVLFTSPELMVPAIIGGRSIHPLDAMNTSILMDVMILRSSDPKGFENACLLIASHPGEPFQVAKQVRECFTNSDFRQS